MAATSVLRKHDAREFRCIVDDEGSLGEGGFGKVQFAFHNLLVKVALKCFPVATRAARKRETISEQIKHEMETLQRAQNPRVVRVHGWTQWSNAMAIVMEYMSAGSLDYLIFNQSVELAPVLRLQFCFEISDGIEFIHNIDQRKRLIHGDLKPQNILLDDKLHCKIGDFGGANVTKFTSSITSSTGSSPTHQHLTKLYAAPERLKGTNGRPRKEHDTYSFGVIVHSVLSREQPDQWYENTDSYLDAVKNDERPDADKVIELRNDAESEDQEIIDVLDSEMKRCWVQNPGNRPNMTDVRDKLQICYNKQSADKIAHSLKAAVDKVNIFSPSDDDEYTCKSLTLFDPDTGDFNSAPDSAQAINERSGSSMAANQRNVEPYDVISLQAPSSDSLMNTDNTQTTTSAQPASYAFVTGSKLPPTRSDYKVKFRVGASEKYCGKLLKILYEILREIGQQYNDPGDGRCFETDKFVEEILFSGASNWQEYHNLRFKMNLLNRFSKIGWEREDGNDVFDKNGITFRKKY